MRVFFLMLLLATTEFFGQVYNYPFPFRKDNNSVGITSVEIQQKYIKVSMEYIGSYLYENNTAWIRINPETKLINHETGEEADLIKVENISYQQGKTIVPQGKLHKFTLYFDKINLSAKAPFSIIEGNDIGYFNFHYVIFAEGKDNECRTCGAKDDIYKTYIPIELTQWIDTYLRNESADKSDLRDGLRRLKENINNTSIRDVIFHSKDELIPNTEDIVGILVGRELRQISLYFKKGENGRRIETFAFVFGKETDARKFFNSISKQGNLFKIISSDKVIETVFPPNGDLGLAQVVYTIEFDKEADIWFVVASTKLLNQ